MTCLTRRIEGGRLILWLDKRLLVPVHTRVAFLFLLTLVLDTHLFGLRWIRIRGLGSSWELSVSTCLPTPTKETRSRRAHRSFDSTTLAREMYYLNQSGSRDMSRCITITGTCYEELELLTSCRLTLGFTSAPRCGQGSGPVHDIIYPTAPAPRPHLLVPKYPHFIHSTTEPWPR